MPGDSGALSRSEQRLALWMRASAALYVAGGLVFLVGHPWLFELINAGGRILGLADTPPSTERFWLALSLSMMVMLVVCSTLCARDVRKARDFAIPVIFSKFTSTLLGVVFFAIHARYSAYLAIGLSDLPLGIVTLHLWRRARVTP